MKKFQSIEAEQQVLASALDARYIDDLMAITRDEMFSHPDNLEIYRTIKAMYSKAVPMDVFLLLDAMKGSSAHSYAADLIRVPASANYRWYVDILKEHAAKRKLSYIATEIQALLAEEESQIVLERVSTLLADAGEARAERGPRQFSDIFLEYGPELDRRSDNEGTLNGVSTGFGLLDARLNGLAPSDLIIVAARPSMGKTTFSLNICENVALAGGTVLIFSMEMKDRSLIEKTIASVGRIECEKLKRGSVYNEQEDTGRLVSAVTRLKDSGLWIDDRPALSPTDVRAAALKVKRKAGKLDLIMVDYLQLMRIPGFSEGRVNEVSEISRSLKALAKEIDCPVIALSQLNRSLEQRPNKRPMNSDLRESGAIEQDADVIMFIYRDEVYNENSPNKGVAEIIFGKFREGQIGTDHLAFLGKYSRFENLAPEWTAREEQSASANFGRGFSYDD